jgi:hypothetical protein
LWVVVGEMKGERRESGMVAWKADEVMESG